ncbi:hypothetical protein TSAR_012753 [Trichomalopsis sarcophagae]|uniref:Uncharacterized protein n=1 Tax=Trichomalopsis sarcophagae TaxID=543379 RepID=A0A232EK24_9HYME|nr:hypothetical protein TSAR_012753 [Trichomalopsis sarcophagae]
MDPNVEHYYFESTLRTFNRINNGDISPEQFVHEISHATAYLSYFGQQQMFHRILECDNTHIYYELRKIELKNLPYLINFLTEAFLCPYSFGYFANILQKAKYQLRNSQPHLSNLFIKQLDILAIMVTLYQDVYDSAPECLDDAAKLADHLYYTNGPRHRPIISKSR